MTDIGQYLASGILEEYSMGWLSSEDRDAVISMSLLHPDIAAELAAIEYTLERYAALHAVEPDSRLKQRIMDVLGFNTRTSGLALHNLPLTSAEADHLQWLEALKHLIPDNPAEDFIAEPLRNEPRLAQTLIITKCDVPEETHGDLIESFFILKGECICLVGNETYHLHAGSFLEIPLHVQHTIQIITPYVVGILQHRMLEV